MTIHKERRERIEDKNRIIAILNERIEELNQKITILTIANEQGFKLPPHVFQVIEDTGKRLILKTILRVSETPKGFEILIC